MAASDNVLHSLDVMEQLEVKQPDLFGAGGGGQASSGETDVFSSPPHR